MRKTFYIVFTFIIFLIFSIEAKAARGDLIYEVEKVVLNDNSITISGYAFIHRTNNYVTVYELDENGHETNNIVKSGGGQNVRIKISSSSGKTKIFEDKHQDNDNYNFYYQMFTHNTTYNVAKYNDASKNMCEAGSSANKNNHCYYEDIGFEIVINLHDIIPTFDYGEEIRFEIAATNNDYGKWTNYKEMKISNIKGTSQNIELVEGRPNGKVKFTATIAQFQKLNSQIKYTYNGKSYLANTGSYYHIFDLDDIGYKNGFIKGINICYLNQCFLKDTYSPGKYAVCANLNTGNDACDEIDSNGYCKRCNVSASGKDGVQMVSVYGSWIELEGTGQLVLKINNSGCPVVTPSNGPLECNNNKKFESTCDTLTVEGKKVQIVQTGIISSVLTPDKIYAGGGFNFGVMYYNTVKWSYVDTPATGTLHETIKGKMEEKIYNYSDFKSRINITQLKIGNKTYDSSFLEKKCTASSNNKNYYNDELTMSCVFSFPESILHYNGDVEYKTSTGTFNINNKYYTPVNYSGKYKLEASIVNMSRITDVSATNDSNDSSPWTGSWHDNFSNCEIDLYSLLRKSNGNYNFIYRPIDIYNPFPNRNAGINWYDWFSVTANQERIKNTYKNNAEYTASFDNQKISEIKEYNKSNNYLNWDSIDVNGNSSFITDNNYVSRGDGS